MTNGSLLGMMAQRGETRASFASLSGLPSEPGQLTKGCVSGADELNLSGLLEEEVETARYFTFSANQGDTIFGRCSYGIWHWKG
jgi:hypothetical protein